MATEGVSVACLDSFARLGPGQGKTVKALLREVVPSSVESRFAFCKAQECGTNLPGQLQSVVAWSCEGFKTLVL